MIWSKERKVLKCTTRVMFITRAQQMRTLMRKQETTIKTNMKSTNTQSIRNTVEIASTKDMEVLESMARAGTVDTVMEIIMHTCFRILRRGL